MLNHLHPDHVIVACFAGLLVLAAVNDATRFRIPNWASVSVAALYPLHVMLSPVPVAWGSAVVLAVVLFAFGAVLFARGIVGGGDVKFLAATALWSGVEHSATLLVVMAFTGGAMALAMMGPVRELLVHAYDRFGGDGNPVADNMLPYGIAIAAGGFAVAVKLATI